MEAVAFRHLLKSKLGALLVVAFGQVCGSGFEVAEEAPAAFVGACGEVELGAGSAGGIVAAGCGVVGWADIPEAIDSDGLSVCVLQQAFELSGDQVIYCDGSAAFGGAATGELADEEIVTDGAEVLRGRATPQGALSQSPCSRRWIRRPLAVKMST